MKLSDDLPAGGLRMEALPEHAVEGEGVGVDALAAVGTGVGLREKGRRREVGGEGELELTESEEADVLKGLGARAHGVERGAKSREDGRVQHRAVVLPPY